jgi:hypothetical protein
VPLYYTVTQADGGWRRTTQVAPETYRQRLHIGWEAFWTRRGVPRWADLSAAEPWQDSIDLRNAPRGGRFLTEAALEPGDRMIPLVMGKTGDYAAPVAVAYDFNSSLKGGAVVVTMRGPAHGMTPAEQAVILTRAMLLVFDTGVERVFWYEFQAPERAATDKEHHFGITHRDLSPKPAYKAYAVLTDLRPPGSTKLGALRREGGACAVGWQRPDDRTVWAVWNPTSIDGQHVVVTDPVLARNRQDHRIHVINLA